MAVQMTFLSGKCAMFSYVSLIYLRDCGVLDTWALWHDVNIKNKKKDEKNEYKKIEKIKQKRKEKKERKKERKKKRLAKAVIEVKKCHEVLVTPPRVTSLNSNSKCIYFD